MGSKRISTRTSHVVPHRSTTRARGSLTSQIGRDVVLSAWYGRFQPPLASVTFSSLTQTQITGKKKKKKLRRQFKMQELLSLLTTLGQLPPKQQSRQGQIDNYIVYHRTIASTNHCIFSTKSRLFSTNVSSAFACSSSFLSSTMSESRCEPSYKIGNARHPSSRYEF